MNEIDIFSPETSLEILARETAPEPKQTRDRNIRWTQKDLDEVVAFIFKCFDKNHDTMLKAVGKFCRDEIAKATAPLKARIAELETVSKEFTYCGTWDAQAVYYRNNSVTHNGSLWIAIRDTKGRIPETHDSDWKLAVKRGKDARVRAA